MEKIAQLWSSEWTSFQKSIKWMSTHPEAGMSNWKTTLSRLSYLVASSLFREVFVSAFDQGTMPMRSVEDAIHAMRPYLGAWAKSRAVRGEPLPAVGLCREIFAHFSSILFSSEETARGHLDSLSTPWADKQWNRRIHPILNFFGKDPAGLQQIQRSIFTTQDVDSWVESVLDLKWMKSHVDDSFHPETQFLNLNQEQWNQIRESVEDQIPEQEMIWDEEQEIPDPDWGFMAHDYVVAELFFQLLSIDLVSLNEDLKSVADKVFSLMRRMFPEMADGAAGTATNRLGIMGYWKSIVVKLQKLIEETKKFIEENPIVFLNPAHYWQRVKTTNYRRLSDDFAESFQNWMLHKDRSARLIDYGETGFFASLKDYLDDKLPVWATALAEIYIAHIISNPSQDYAFFAMPFKYFQVLTPRDVWNMPEMRKQILSSIKNLHSSFRRGKFLLEDQLRGRGIDDPAAFVSDPANQEFLRLLRENARNVPESEFPEFEWEKHWEKLREVDPEEHVSLMETRKPSRSEPTRRETSLRRKLFKMSFALESFDDFESADRLMLLTCH